MAQLKKGDAHGLAYVQVALVGTNGYAYGQVGSSLAQAADSGAYLISEPKSATMPTPDRNTINFTGGDIWLGAYQYGIDAVGSFDMTVSGFDADLIALVTGSAVDQTWNQQWTLFSENELANELPQVCMIFSYRLQARGPSDGAALWINTIIPRAWCGPRGLTGAPSFQSAGEYSFTVTPTSSTVIPNGSLLSATSLALERNKGFRVHVIADKPLGLHTFIADGSATTFTLDYLPTDDTVTLSNAGNLMAIDGTLTAASSVNTSSGLVTLSAAGSADDIVTMLYETNFVAS